MTAYSLTAWHWRKSHDTAVRPQNSVSQLLGRLQAHVQRNLLLTVTGEAAEAGAQQSAAPAGIFPAGESGEWLASVCAGAAVKHRARQVVTAVRMRNHRLELASWRVNADGSVILTGRSGLQPEGVTQLDLVRANKYVVAYRSLAQELRLISWDVSNTGAIYRAGGSAAWNERVRQVRLCTVDDQLVVTACLTRARQLKLVSWRLGEDANLAVCAEQAGEQANVRAIAVARLPPTADGARLATLSRVDADKLILQIWQVNQAGELRLGSQAQLTGGATQLQLVVSEHGHLIAAMRTRAGGVRMVGWAIGAGSETSQPLFDLSEQREFLRRIALAPCPGGIVVLVGTTTGQLKVIHWQLSAEGILRRGAESPALAAAAGPLLLCPELLDGNAQLLAGMRTSATHFKLATWHI